MELKNITLYNFRNYVNSSFAFGKMLNVLVGNNAAGKTSVLEAIHYLITSKSNITKVDSEAINYSASESVIKGVFYNEKSEKKPILLISKDYKKMSLNGKVVKKASEFIGFASVVSFGTEDVYLIGGAPSKRRQMIDFELCQSDKRYMAELKQYKSILKEKNALLKKIKESRKSDDKLLDVFDEQLFKSSRVIEQMRQDYIDKLNVLVGKIYGYLSETEGLCKISLTSQINKTTTIKNLIERRKTDIYYGTSTFGVHRDDYVFKLNDKEIARYGSQGQKKTAMLSFKLACARYLKQEKGVVPIVMLDDVFGELDANRQNKLVRLLQDGGQTIITTPSLADIDQRIIDKANIIYVKKEEK